MQTDEKPTYEEVVLKYDKLATKYSNLVSEYQNLEKLILERDQYISELESQTTIIPVKAPAMDEYDSRN